MLEVREETMEERRKLS